MNKHQCIILKIRNFQENKKIVRLISKENEIRDTILKTSLKNNSSYQIGDFIDCNFFGRENSLGFVLPETIIAFGRMFSENRVDFSLLYSTSELINLFFPKDGKIYFDLFDSMLIFFNLLKNSKDINEKISKYAEFEANTINQSGWFYIENKENDLKKNLNENYRKIIDFKKRSYSNKIDLILETSRRYIINAL